MIYTKSGPDVETVFTSVSRGSSECFRVYARDAVILIDRLKTRIEAYKYAISFLDPVPTGPVSASQKRFYH